MIWIFPPQKKNCPNFFKVYFDDKLLCNQQFLQNSFCNKLQVSVSLSFVSVHFTLEFWASSFSIRSFDANSDILKEGVATLLLLWCSFPFCRQFIIIWSESRFKHQHHVIIVSDCTLISETFRIPSRTLMNNFEWIVEINW